MPNSITYPEFEYQANELSAYVRTLDIFVISLKNKSVTVFSPQNPLAFEIWLNKNGVRNINHRAVKN